MSVKKSVAFMVLGLLAFLLYLHFFVGFDEILNILQQVDPLEYALYYSMTVAAIVLSMLFYAMVWHELLKVLSIKITLKRTFLYSWLGNFVDLVLPLETVTGEITRLYLLHNDVKDDIGKGVASLVSHRIISIFTTLSGLIVSSLYLVLRYSVEPSLFSLLASVTGGTAATIIILFYLSVREEAAEKIVNALIRLAGVVVRKRSRLVDLKRKAKRTLSTFHRGVKILRTKPKHLIKPMIYSYISWFFHVIIYFLVFYALGFSAVGDYVFQMIIVISITLAVQTIPVGFPIGLVEVVMLNLFNLLFGTPPAFSSLATTLIRVVTFWFQILVGYIIVQWMGIKHLLNRNLMQKKSVPESEGSR